MTLNGKIALVTGGTDGIGKEVALRLLRNGVGEVILVGRNSDKGIRLVNALRSEFPASKIDFWQADLTVMANVQALADKFRAYSPRLDILVHCAGLTLRHRTLTADGFETVFATQHLARFWLTNQLLECLSTSSAPVVVNVSAGGEENVKFDFDNLHGEKYYSGTFALQHESIANDMFTLEIQARHPNIRFFCYGPGVVKTELLRDLHPVLKAFARLASVFIGITPQSAGDDVLLLITSDWEGGLYTRKGRRNLPKGFRAEAQNRARLWDISETSVTTAILASKSKP